MIDSVIHVTAEHDNGRWASSFLDAYTAWRKISAVGSGLGRGRNCKEGAKSLTVAGGKENSLLGHKAEIEG